MSDYYILITDAGAALEASAHAAGTTVKLAKFGVCDGGVDFIPDPAATTFANEVFQSDISSLTVSADDATVMVAQCIIPGSSGGYTIRGIAIYTDDGTLYATGNYPDQPKPAPDSGFAASLEILAQLAVSDTADVSLTVTEGNFLTETQGNTLYLRQDKRLSEIAAAGADAQSAARKNIALGTVATLDATTSTTDNTIGHVLKVGDRGLGATILGRLDNFDFNSYILAAGETLFITMATAKNIPDELSPLSATACYLTALGVEDGAGGVSFVISDASTGEAYFCTRLPPSGGVVGWFINKLPTTAADVSALALSSVSFSTGTDFNDAPAGSTSFAYSAALNAPPEHCVVIDWWGLNGEFRGQLGAGYTSGMLYFRGLNGNTGDWSPWDRMYSVNYPQDMSAYMASSTANGKFVTGVRFGANTQVYWGSNGGVAPAGCALTGGDFGDDDSYPYYAYLQYCINGTWINASGGVGAENLVSANHYQAVPDGTISLLTNLRPYLRESNHLPGLAGIQHYIDDNGYDWFEAAPKLAGAVFIAVAPESGVIVQIADSSLPDTDALSLYPNGVTVAGLDSLPAGCTIDGTWKFDAESRTVSQDADLAAALALTKNTQLRAKYATNAALNIATLQAGIASDHSIEGDSDALTAWQGYLCDLRAMTPEQLEQSPASFPAAPASIF